MYYIYIYIYTYIDISHVGLPNPMKPLDDFNSQTAEERAMQLTSHPGSNGFFLPSC